MFSKQELLVQIDCAKGMAQSAGASAGAGAVLEGWMTTGALLCLSATAASVILWHPAFGLFLDCCRTTLAQCYHALRLLLVFAWFLLRRSRSTLVAFAKALHKISRKVLIYQVP